MGLINAIENNLANQWLFATKSLTAAQVKTAFSSPILFDSIPQPKSNQVVIIRNWGFTLNFATTAYTAGGGINLYYDNTRTQAATALMAVGNMTVTSSACPTGVGITSIITSANTAAFGKPIYISNATQNFASGDSPVTFFAYYSILQTDATKIINCVGNRGSAGFQFASLYIPFSQARNLDTTPLDIVPVAPGSGKILVPDRLTNILLYGGTPYNSSTLQLIYKTSGQSVMATGLINQSSTSMQTTALNTSFSGFTSSNGDNNALQIKAANNLGTSGNSDIIIHLSYSECTL